MVKYCGEKGKLELMVRTKYVYVKGRRELLDSMIVKRVKSGRKWSTAEVSKGGK